MYLDLLAFLFVRHSSGGRGVFLKDFAFALQLPRFFPLVLLKSSQLLGSLLLPRQPLLPGEAGMLIEPQGQWSGRTGEGGLHLPQPEVLLVLFVLLSKLGQRCVLLLETPNLDLQLRQSLPQLCGLDLLLCSNRKQPFSFVLVLTGIRVSWSPSQLKKKRAILANFKTNNI